jgi:cell division septation protein DedD
MAEYRDIQGAQKEGLSVRQLVLLFLAGVAVCAVFFALGFVVGYNERPSVYVAESERVAGSGSVIPPVVNRPVENDQPPPTNTSAPAGKASEPQTERLSGSEPEAEPSEAPPVSQKPSNPRSDSAEANLRAEAGIVLQVVASSSQKDAENLVSTLKSRGYPAFLVTPQQAHASDNLFRVQVGPFATRQNAEKFRKKLSDEGFHPFFRH